MVKTILLFDVDGTLTVPRKRVTQEMDKFLADLQKNDDVTVGVVGGSDLKKIKEQLGDDVLDRWQYVFAQNGLDAYTEGKVLDRQNFKNFMGEEKLQQLINFILRYVADMEIPQKRGTFIEFRSGMLNVSPIGRNCSQEERDAFEQYDKKTQVRAKFVAALKEKFPDFGLTYSIGGQISFDVFPNGWDKTYCLKYVKAAGFDNIHFFGDKTYKGGNDYEIFMSSETKGHTVTSPANTREKVNKILGGTDLPDESQ